MKFLPTSAGWRTFYYGVIGLAVLLAGYVVALLWPEACSGMFPTYAGTVATLVGIVAAKHGVESLATGGGIAGVLKAIGTAAKPENTEEHK